MTAPAAIAFDRVSKSYDGAAILDAVSLRIAAGEFVALAGPSGAGKTTLLKLVNRLIDADRGDILVGGVPVRDRDPAVLRRSIGYVFQGVGLFPHMSVGENIAITPRLLGWPPRAIAARIRELLNLIRLPAEYAARQPAALSGGERQRVGVARALAAGPSVMLMDEPFGALDAVTRDDLGSAYRQLHDTLGLTTVMVTHDWQEALLLADRIIVLRGGGIVADGSPAELVRHARDPDVAAAIAVPRRQAERIQALRGDGA